MAPYRGFLRFGSFHSVFSSLLPFSFLVCHFFVFLGLGATLVITFMLPMSRPYILLAQMFFEISLLHWIWWQKLSCCMFRCSSKEQSNSGYSCVGNQHYFTKAFHLGCCAKCLLTFDKLRAKNAQGGRVDLATPKHQPAAGEVPPVVPAWYLSWKSRVYCDKSVAERWGIGCWI